MDFQRLNIVFSSTVILVWGLAAYANESGKEEVTVDESAAASVVSVPDEQAEAHESAAVVQDDCD